MPSEHQYHTEQSPLFFGKMSVIDQVQGPQSGPPSTTRHFPDKELGGALVIPLHLLSFTQICDLGGSLPPTAPDP